MHMLTGTRWDVEKKISGGILESKGKLHNTGKAYVSTVNHTLANTDQNFRFRCLHAHFNACQ